MITANEIRQEFLHYFEENGHAIVPSSSLIPLKDPTLLFTNAGMVQFKGIFTGEEKAPCPRATSSQKCVRAGGKHNDLENVGHTARHHTFFEMLGNYSFGDYFKEAAIRMAWEFLTERLHLPTDNLWITTYRDDEEAFSIWHRQVGIREERIIRMGEKDNFWAMGDTGPCGPCSEIIIDQGEGSGCGKPDCRVGCDCDRFLELWNLVFMQYQRDAAGRQHPLPHPCIDTGMGLERIAAVIQQVKNNYQTDLFSPLIRDIERRCRIPYGESKTTDTSINVIADHLRAITFLISDGILPSNEGRGYVLRRIIRRAARHGRKVNLTGPFLYRSSGVVADAMSDAYPELIDARPYVARVVQAEEERFTETLDSGLRILQDEVTGLRAGNKKVLSGEAAFKLYDTYGFPLDLTADILREEGMTVDADGFHRAMDLQKKRARKAWKGSGEEAIDQQFRRLAASCPPSSFTGYDLREESATVLALVMEGQEVSTATEGDEVLILTDKTPFYGESGGQVGDRGTIDNHTLLVEVDDTIRPLPALIFHRGLVRRGSLAPGDTVQLRVDTTRRSATEINHTATHLLQAALREVLGDHVKQKGSLVTPGRFRFDFTHFAAVTGDELDRIEMLVNRRIRENHPVETRTVPYREALDQGALALFGEKYSDTVRMVTIDTVSRELCGGTHTTRTGNIGLMKLVTESSVAAGIRRIEAVTGEAAIIFIKETEKRLAKLAKLIKAQPEEIIFKTSKIMDEFKSLQKELARLKMSRVTTGADTLLKQAREIKGVKVISTRIEAGDPKSLREYADRIKDQLKSGVIIVGGTDKDKALLVGVVTRDLTSALHAGRIIKEVARGIGGTGGGREDMAQAGGKDTGNLDDALQSAYGIIGNMLSP